MSLSGSRPSGEPADERERELELRSKTPATVATAAVYGQPPEFGHEQLFGSLDEALAWANGDGSCVMLIVSDELDLDSPA